MAGKSQLSRPSAQETWYLMASDESACNLRIFA